MFEALSDRLTGVFRKLGGRGRLTEKQIDEALREVRVALLEADVNFKVARGFIERVKEGVMHVVQDELTAILGGTQKKLTAASKPPTVVMMAGLQGSGKTTTAAKLALYLKRQGNRPLLVAADVKRPAAVEQLMALGKQIGIPVHEEGTDTTGLEVCKSSLAKAKKVGANWVILDTAGRLHIDKEMMAELREIDKKLKPTETLLVLDAMTGQDAVRAAEEFHEQVHLTGLVLTKLDGDARGGAALSVSSVTGLPIKFIGNGEKPEAFEAYHPDRLASRILGMGDMATLIEKAQETIDEDQAKALEQKLRKATFDLEDFLGQLGQVKKMGSLTNMLDMIPGGKFLRAKIPTASLDDRQFAKVEAIILSMTPLERHKPELIGGSRRKRIANGSGTTPADVNRLLNQFDQMRKMMKRMASGRMKGMPQFPGMMR